MKRKCDVMSSYKISMKRNNALLFAAAIFATLFSWALAAPGVYAAQTGFTPAEVSTHNTSADCWLFIDSNVFNVTGLIASHSGGSSVISTQCGKNATAVFNSFPHSQSIMDLLLSLYYVGDLATPDTLPPVVTIVSPAGVTYPSSSVALNYNVVDSGSGVNASACAYSLDGGVAVPLAGCSNSTLSGLADGLHTVYVYARDIAGNAGNASRAFAVNTTPQPPVPDTVPPVVTIISPANLTYASSSVVLSYIVSDSGSGVNMSACSYSLDGGAAVSLPACANTSFSVPAGAHTLAVSSRDIAGNAGNASRSFTVDLVSQPPSSPPNSTHGGRHHPPKNVSRGHDDDHEDDDDEDHAPVFNFSFKGHDDDNDEDYDDDRDDDDHAWSVNYSSRGHDDDDDERPIVVNSSLPLASSLQSHYSGAMAQAPLGVPKYAGYAARAMPVVSNGTYGIVSNNGTYGLALIRPDGLASARPSGHWLAQVLNERFAFLRRLYWGSAA